MSERGLHCGNTLKCSKNPPIYCGNNTLGKSVDEFVSYGQQVLSREVSPVLAFCLFSFVCQLLPPGTNSSSLFLHCNNSLLHCFFTVLVHTKLVHYYTSSLLYKFFTVLVFITVLVFLLY